MYEKVLGRHTGPADGVLPPRARNVSRLRRVYSMVNRGECLPVRERRGSDNFTITDVGQLVLSTTPSANTGRGQYEGDGPALRTARPHSHDARAMVRRAISGFSRRIPARDRMLWATLAAVRHPLSFSNTSRPAPPR